MKLVIRDIVKGFGDKSVLKGASYEFGRGRIYGLLGRNGSGKTTLFKSIYGDFDDVAGEIELLDDAGGARKPGDRDIGMVFSQPVLPEFLTGYEFISFYLDVHGRGRDAETEDYFRMFDFDEADIHRLIKGYSHGMKSKLNLMTLFIAEPEVMLLDEPLTSLDVVVASQIKSIMMKLKENHIILFSTHILQLARDMCDEIVLLKDGRLEGLRDLDRSSADYEQEVIRHLTEEGSEESG